MIFSNIENQAKNLKEIFADLKNAYQEGFKEELKDENGNLTGEIGGVKGGIKNTIQSFLGEDFKEKTGHIGVKLADDKEIAKIRELNDLIKQGKYGTTEWKEATEGVRDEIKKLYEGSEPLEQSLQDVGDATYAGATGFQLMNLKFKQFVFLAKAAARQFIAFFIVTEGISLVMRGLSALGSKIKDAATGFGELRASTKEALESAQSNLKSVEDELSSITDRISELQGKGPLSLSEQDELKQLRLQNIELERKVALLKETEEVAARENTEANLRALQFFQNNTNTSDYMAGNYEYGSSMDQIQDYSKKYSEIVAEINALNPNASNYNKELDNLLSEKQKYYNKLIDLTSESSEILLNLDDRFLNEEQRAMKESLNTITNNALNNIGVLSTGDLLSSLIPEGDIDSFNKRINRLIESSTDIPRGVNLIHALGLNPDDLEAAGISVHALRKHILSLRDTDKVIDGLLGDGGQFADSDLNDQIQGLVKSTQELNMDTITKALGEDFVRAVFNASEGITESDLIGYLKRLREEANYFSFSNAISELSTMSEALETSTAAYSEFVENRSVTIDTLGKMNEKFADVSDTEAFAIAMQTLSNSSSSLSEVENALEGLLNAYVFSTDTMVHLDEQSKSLYVQQLKNMGVTNALEVAEWRLAQNRLLNAEAGSAEAEAAREAMNAYFSEAGAVDILGGSALNAADKLALIESYQAYIGGSNFADAVKQHANAILAVGRAAGSSADILVRYATILNSIAKIQATSATTPAQIIAQLTQLSVLRTQAEAIKAQAERQYNALFIPSMNYSYKPGTSSSYKPPKDSSSGSTKTPAEKRRDAFKDEKDALDYQLRMELITYQQYYDRLKALGDKYYKGQSDNAADYREHLEDLAGVRKDAFDYYRDYYKDKSIEQEDDIDVYARNIKSLIDKWLSGDGNKADRTEALKELADDVFDYWEDKIKETDDLIKDNDKFDEWAPGENAVTAWNNLWQEIQNSFNAGTINKDQFTELSKEIREQLLDAGKDVYEEYTNYIDDIVKMTSDMLKQEANDMIDALEEQSKAFSDIIDKKKEILSLSQEEIKYQKQLEDINKDLTDLQAQAALLALDTSREGQRKYAEIQEQIRAKEEELSSLQTEHAQDATVKALDNAAEMFDKKITEQTDAIKEMMDNAGLWLQKIYEYIEKYGTTTLLGELLEYNKVHGDGVDKTVNDMWTGANPLLTQYDWDVKKILEELGVEDWLKQTTSYGDFDKRPTVGGTTSGAPVRNNVAQRPLYETTSIAGDTADAILTAMRRALLKRRFDDNVFHDGLSAGFVGGKNPDKQETYALLRNDELVLNHNDQARLGKQLQLLSSVTDMFNGINRQAASTIGALPSNNVEIAISSPITINGNADENVLAKLDSYADKIASRAMDTLQNTMKKKGFNSRINYNVLRK